MRTKPLKPQFNARHERNKRRATDVSSHDYANPAHLARA